MTKCIFKENTEVGTITDKVMDLMNLAYQYGGKEINSKDYDEKVKALWKEIYSNAKWIEGD